MCSTQNKMEGNGKKNPFKFFKVANLDTMSP